MLLGLHIYENVQILTCRRLIADKDGIRKSLGEPSKSRITRAEEAIAHPCSCTHSSQIACSAQLSKRNNFQVNFARRITRILWVVNATHYVSSLRHAFQSTPPKFKNYQHFNLQKITPHQRILALRATEELSTTRRPGIHPGVTGYGKPHIKALFSKGTATAVPQVVENKCRASTPEARLPDPSLPIEHLGTRDITRGRRISEIAYPPTPHLRIGILRASKLARLLIINQIKIVLIA